MKIKYTIMYNRPYIPKGCRKPRYEDIKETVTLNIREVNIGDLQLAMIAEGFHLYGVNRKVKIFAYKGKLYREKELYPGFADEYGFSTALEELIYLASASSKYYAKTKRYDLPSYLYFSPDNQETRNDIMKRLRRDLSKLLLVDGVLYEQTTCPKYHLVTFGWGGCGTALALTGFRYSRKAKVGMRGLYWSALDYQAAIEKANEVAASRGDIQDIGKFRKLVDVYMPEMVKRVYL